MTRSIVAMLALTLFVGCGPLTDNPGASTDPMLVGRFEGHGVYFEFSATGFFENGDLIEPEFKTTGTWFTVDGELTMTSDEGIGTTEYLVDATSFTLLISDDYTPTYIRQ